MVAGLISPPGSVSEAEPKRFHFADHPLSLRVFTFSSRARRALYDGTSLASMLSCVSVPLYTLLIRGFFV